jgi:hypothetical protein
MRSAHTQRQHVLFPLLSLKIAEKLWKLQQICRFIKWPSASLVAASINAASRQEAGHHQPPRPGHDSHHRRDRNRTRASPGRAEQGPAQPGAGKSVLRRSLAEALGALE